jgi:DNA-binding HxlR family transcriptional regulator
MRTYGQYCPIARGAEIFAERWTPLIIRNLHLGCETFGEILEGAPGLSRTVLTQRLKQLERLGIVESAPKAQGRGHRYQLTSSGHDLFRVCETLGEWGARWLDIVARRAALLGAGHPRLPDPAPRSRMARADLPELERPQHVRPHQARRRRCHRELTQRPAAEPPQWGAI